MTKTLKIFFIGRKHGVIPFRARSWKLENQRKGELDGFKAARGIVRTYSPARADVIFVRNKQEYTKARDIKNIEKKIGRYRSKKPILNDIKYFQNYNSKDITFSIWHKNGVPIPAYKVLDITDSEQTLVNEVVEFLASYPSMILRSTNDESGLGMFFIDNGMDQIEITEKVRECKAHIIQNKGLRADSGIMAVEYIGDYHFSRYQYLCRAYCVGSDIVALWCTTGKKHVLHARNMAPEDFDEFVTMNMTLVPRLKNEPFRSQILKAVDCLGIKVTAIDFIYKDDAIYFLEVNPIWGAGYSFGNDAFKVVLKQKRAALQEQIPDIYELIDGVPFYRRFYESICNYSRKFYSS